MHFVRVFVWMVVGFTTALPVRGFADGLTDQKAVSHDDQSFRISKPDSSETHHDAKFAYDSRYMKQLLNKTAHRDAARTLIQSYLITCRELQVQTWLMNGSLLGWWWGKKMLPWDYSSNVQITEADLHFLAAYHNASVHFHKRKAMPKGKRFLLEISPDFTNRAQTGATDVIDARWTDLGSGLYLNITAVRYSPDHPSGEGVLYTKNGQQFHDTLLHPLRDTTFEGEPVKIPYRYKTMLAERYGEEALKKTHYNGHKFDTPEMQWVMQG
ncbi:putative mannosylphosphorylation protein (Mnn4) [Metarhizium anisopliae]|nr:putative mannosylphosphorylation protein (Mnn4) [Metarhizium anisopliae]